MRAIERLVRPSEDKGAARTKLQLKPLSLLFDYAFLFAPDRETLGALEELKSAFGGTVASLVEMEEDLEGAFFDDLYVDRPECEILASQIPMMRPILFSGLVGSGKTIVLKKLGRDYAAEDLDFSYIDCKEDWFGPGGPTPEEFASSLDERLYSFLYDSYIGGRETKELRDAWRTFFVMTDPSPHYSRLRERIQLKWEEAIVGEDGWREVLGSEKGHAWLDKELRERRPELATLIRFLKERQLVCICIDNVDRFELPYQRALLSAALRISNSGKIAVLISIRDSNLRRITDEAADGDVVVAESADRVPNTVDDTLELGELRETEIRDLVLKRVAFVRTHVDQNLLDELFKGQATRLETFAEFESQFWLLIRQMAGTFIEQGIYQWQNHNIRLMLVMYYRFLEQILLYSAEPYRIETLLTDHHTIRITKLRTFFFKWLLFGSKAEQPESLSLPNVFDGPQDARTRWLPVRLLAYLASCKIRFNEPRYLFKTLLKRLAPLRVARSEIEACLILLSRTHGSHLGLVRIENVSPHEADGIPDDAIVEILPAGEYFLDELSVSREYVFWAALLADLEYNVAGKAHFTIEDSASPAFKLDVVLKLLKKDVIPQFLAETEFFNKELLAPAGYPASNLRCFKELVGWRDSFYPRRLLSYSEVTVNPAFLPRDKERTYHKRFRELGTRLHDVEKLARRPRAV